jgi:hypothetical protein
MAKASMGEEPEIELRPDGWERFEKAVDAAASVKPQKRRGSGSGQPRPRDDKRRRAKPKDQQRNTP